MNEEGAFYASVAGFLKAMEALGGQYMFIGAIPLSAWGQPRASTDADFMTSLQVIDAWDLDSKMAGAGFAKLSGPVQIPQKPLVVSKYEWSGPEGKFDVDVFLATSDFDREALSRRVQVRFGSRNYWMTTAEDLLLYKLLAWRKRDVDDAASIVGKSSATMDWEYVKQWAARMGLSQLLAQLLKDVAEGRE